MGSKLSGHTGARKGSEAKARTSSSTSSKMQRKSEIKIREMPASTDSKELTSDKRQQDEFYSSSNDVDELDRSDSLLAKMLELEDGEFVHKFFTCYYFFRTDRMIDSRCENTTSVQY